MAPLFPECDYEHIIVNEAVDIVGPIDVLVCNQGVFVAQELENQEMKEIRDMIEINLIGTFNLVKAALPSMKSRTDRKPVSIAFMSSQAGQVHSVSVCVLQALLLSDRLSSNVRSLPLHN